MSSASQVCAASPVSRLKDPKIPCAHPAGMFFQDWSHSGEKSAPPLPSHPCAVSRGRPVTGRHGLQTTRCQDRFDKSVMEAFLGTGCRFLRQPVAPSPPHAHTVHSLFFISPKVKSFAARVLFFFLSVRRSGCSPFFLALFTALWQDQMDTPTLKTCKVEEDLRPWAGEKRTSSTPLLFCSVPTTFLIFSLTLN